MQAISAMLIIGFGREVEREKLGEGELERESVKVISLFGGRQDSLRQCSRDGEIGNCHRKMEIEDEKIKPIKRTRMKEWEIEKELAPQQSKSHQTIFPQIIRYVIHSYFIDAINSVNLMSRQIHNY